MINAGSKNVFFKPFRRERRRIARARGERGNIIGNIMPRALGWVLVLIMLGGLVNPVPAHFHMLLPQATSVKRGEPVTIVYQWGHPFEHQLFDTPSPQGHSLRTPNGEFGARLLKVD